MEDIAVSASFYLFTGIPTLFVSSIFLIEFWGSIGIIIFGIPILIGMIIGLTLTTTGIVKLVQIFKRSEAALRNQEISTERNRPVFLASLCLYLGVPGLIGSIMYLQTLKSVPATDFLLTDAYLYIIISCTIIILGVGLLFYNKKKSQ